MHTNTGTPKHLIWGIGDRKQWKDSNKRTAWSDLLFFAFETARLLLIFPISSFYHPLYPRFPVHTLNMLYSLLPVKFAHTIVPFA